MWLVATALDSIGLKAPYLVLPSGAGREELGSGCSLLGEKRENRMSLKAQGRRHGRREAVGQSRGVSSSALGR